VKLGLRVCATTRYKVVAEAGKGFLCELFGVGELEATMVLVCWTAAFKIRRCTARFGGLA